jgi:hypothetical protein
VRLNSLVRYRTQLAIPCVLFVFVTLLLNTCCLREVHDTCSDAHQLPTIAFWVSVIAGCISIVAIGLLAWKLSRFGNDGFGTKLECCIIAITVLIETIGGILMDGISEVALTMWLWSFCLVTFSIIAVWPLIVSYTHERKMADNLKTLESATQLERVLAISDGFEAFLLFTSAEFSSENPLFYKRVVVCRRAPLMFVL